MLRLGTVQAKLMVFSHSNISTLCFDVAPALKNIFLKPLSFWNRGKNELACLYFFTSITIVLGWCKTQDAVLVPVQNTVVWELLMEHLHVGRQALALKLLHTCKRKGDS